MKKFIIIDEDVGIFLGTAKKEDLFLLDVPRDAKLVALFSSNNVLDITKAVGFFTQEDAEDYIKKYLRRWAKEAYIAEVESNGDDPYVDIVDIVKAGYGNHAWDMIDAMPMPSQSLH